MIDIIIDTLLDTLKIIPFLFFTFLLLEYIEHKIDNKKIITSSKKIGPLLGSIIGIFPQCGFSASATNLYATRIISLGTLISVYLSTSDEMLPILLANKVDMNIIIKILLLKFIIAMICGFLIDLIFRRNEKIKIDALCEHEHCHCEHNIFLSSIKHTISISIFILIFSFIINLIFEYLGQNFLANIFMKGTIFSHLLSSLVGLIPNCGSSIMITELYLNNTITFGACMSGLLTGCGIATIILFKTNNVKDSMKILTITYSLGVISGIIIDLLSKIPMI
ncbi:MAG: arsenic efflux protein [Bacilli bacterium]|nr:arsenic efflux protein [Bacilli bacterium]